MQNIPQKQQIQTFLGDLYDRYKIPLLRIVRKHIGVSNACEDVFHEVFIRIIKNAEMLYTFPQPKLEAYIFLVARGVSIDYLRKNYQNEYLDIEDEAFLSLLAQQKKQESDGFDDFQKVNLTQMIGKLPAEDQLLLIGKYYLGLSIKDLVAIAGGTSTAVRSKLHRARKRAYQEWSQSGLKMEDFINE